MTLTKPNLVKPNFFLLSNPFDKLLATCKLNKIMCNSNICTPFNVCVKDKKYSRKINYLPCR